LQERTAKALNDMQNVRPEVDEVLLELWDQIEKHFETESPEVRFAECRKFGIIYYYRRHEEHLY
jgi:hemerythrin